MKTKISIFLLTLLAVVLVSCTNNSIEEAEKHYEAGDYEKTVDILKDSKNNENKAEAYSLEGMAYMQMNDFEKAYESFSKAIELNSDIHENYLNRAIASLKLGENTRAEENFVEAIARIEKFNSEDSKLLLLENYSTFLVINEKYEKALEILDFAESLSIDNGSLYDIRYRALKFLSKDEEALEAISKGIKKYPENGNLNFIMAINKIESGDYEASIDFLDKSKQAGNEEADYYKAIAYRLMADFDNAYKSISEHIEKNTEDAQAYLQKGIILNEQEKFKRAIKQFDKTISLDSSISEVNYYKAISYEGLKDYEKALMYLEKVDKNSEVYDFAREEIIFIKENLINK